jgi:uncharacterized lipoprotein
LKKAWILLIGLLLIGGLSACANKSKIYDDACHGIYEGSKQIQEMKNPEVVRQRQQGEEPPTYEQYKNERQEMLKGNENSPSQK